jgi:hypothetical protein
MGALNFTKIFSSPVVKLFNYGKFQTHTKEEGIVPSPNLNTDQLVISLIQGWSLAQKEESPNQKATNASFV